MSEPASVVEGKEQEVEQGLQELALNEKDQVKRKYTS